MWNAQKKYFSGLCDIHIRNISLKSDLKKQAKNISAKYDSFNPVGFSAGGYIAQEIAAEYPERVNRLVLMNTSGEKHALKNQENRITLLENGRDPGRAGGFQQFKKQLLSTYYESEAVYSPVNRLFAQISLNIFYKQMQAVIDYMVFLPKLSRINCPVMVISSKDDPLIPNSAGTELASGIQNAKHVLCNSGGHMLPISRPDEINRFLRDFFLIVA